MSSNIDRHKLVIIRYSILIAKPISFKLGRENSYESYRDALFDDKRLDVHEYLFLNVTFPSLAKQIEETGQTDITVVVVTSDQLPQRYLNTLEGIERHYSWFRVLKISASESISKKVKATLNFSKPTLVASIRLDDDDALSANFLEQLDKYFLLENADKCISFARGVNCLFCTDTMQYKRMFESLQPKIALGLTYICVYQPETPNEFRIVYDLGNHTKIDQVKTLIVDTEYLTFLRTSHQESDTQGAGFLRKNNLTTSTFPDYLDKMFSVDAKLFCSE